jgi:hypothetical protein
MGPMPYDTIRDRLKRIEKNYTGLLERVQRLEKVFDREAEASSARLGLNIVPRYLHLDHLDVEKMGQEIRRVPVQFADPKASTNSRRGVRKLRIAGEDPSIKHPPAETANRKR